MKKFRLLLMLSSLFAMVFTTACDDAEPEGVKPCSVAIEVVEGGVADTSVSFNVTTEEAVAAKYWVLTAEEDQGVEHLDLSVAQSVSEVNKTVQVDVTGLKPSTEYHIYAYAQNLVHRAFTTEPLVVTTLAAVPAATVVVELEEAMADGAALWVTTTNAAAAWWICVPMGQEVSAEDVKANGTAIAATDLNADAFVEVTKLEAETYYDVYAVVENSEGDLTISDVLNFKALSASAAALQGVTFDIASVKDASQHMMQGVFYFQFENSLTGDNAVLYVYDFTGNPYCNGYYPVVSVDTWEPTAESLLGLDKDESCINVISSGSYTFKEGVDEYGNPYGVNILTAMGMGQDNNMVELNLLAVDDAGNEVLITGTCYEGALGYSGSSAAKTNRDLSTFTSFTKTVMENNVVKLHGVNYAGDLTLYLKTTNGELTNANGGVNYSVEEGTILPESNYFEPLDDWQFDMISGNLYIEKVEGKENTYNFIMSSKRGGLVAEMKTPMALLCEFTPLDTEWEVTIE